MRTFFLLNALGAVLIFTGCFSHREAPERPDSATSLDEALKSRETIQRLILNDAKLSSVPPELATMPMLKILYLRNTGITNFAGLASVVNLKELDLSSIKMEASPEELEAIAGLDRLYLAQCSLKEFPKCLPKTIRYLNLDRNGITSLPAELPTTLLWLRLNYNSITDLGTGIGTLGNLKRLYLKNNRLESLPAEIAGLTEIEDIDLAHNSLAAFPEVLVKLPKLRNLDLRGNTRISTLPENVGEMKSLRLLTLTGCNISKAERDRIQAAIPNCVINF